ncbi:MAG: S8 family peptidase [Geminicoccaceae bacterium]
MAAAMVGLPCLTSCSGGGGGGGSGSNLQTNPSAGFLSPAAEPSLPAVASDWSGSGEYVNSTGLAQLRAAEGYARRSGGLPGGQGVRIAIIDSGIDVTHPDLGNLADISWAAGGEALAGDSHGTFVAGIAGASRTQSADPNDIHGMAYRATLVNFQASRPSQTIVNGSVTFGTDDLVDALRAASGLVASSAAVESDVFNLSLGALSSTDNTFAKLRTAMRSAAARDKIMVLAAGNEGQSSNAADRLQPIYPAAYADDSGIAGLAIVVGNLTATDQAAASSSYCGDTKDYCLFAPGTNIQSTLDGGGYGIGSGTSFAAPYVAGAAAVVKAAFPGVSSRDVVDRLLLTAADLGTAGVDSTFGRGRLDLEAAMAPVGPTGVPIGPTVDGPTLPVQASTLRLGPGLAMNSAAKRLLGRTMAVDSMGFPFPIDLGEAVRTTERDDGLSAFIGGDGRSVAAAGLADARISAFVPEDDLFDRKDILSATSSSYADGDDEIVPLSFAAEMMDGASIFASINGGSQARLGLEAGLAERRATLLQAGGFLAPYGRLAGAPSGAGVSFSPADGTKVSISAFASIVEKQDPQTFLQRFEIMQTMPGKIEVRLGLGFMQEEDGFIGGTSGGAFGDGRSARSRFLTISLLGPLAENVDWFTTFSRGRSSIGEVDGALFGDWSDTRSEAFGAGLVIRDFATDDDGLTLMIGQPFRQDRAETTIELPVARETDGAIVTAKERLDFAPKAREIATEVGYRLPLGDDGNHDLQAAAFLRLNPDHDQDRNPEAGVGLAYRWRF